MGFGFGEEVMILDESLRKDMDHEVYFWLDSRGTIRFRCWEWSTDLRWVWRETGHGELSGTYTAGEFATVIRKFAIETLHFAPEHLGL